MLLPILGDQYGIVLERGELRLDLERDSAYITLRYFEHRLPIDPSTYAALLRQALRTRGIADGAASRELRKLTDAFDRLPRARRRRRRGAARAPARQECVEGAAGVVPEASFRSWPMASTRCSPVSTATSAIAPASMRWTR